MVCEEMNLSGSGMFSNFCVAALVSRTIFNLLYPNLSS